MRVRGLARPGPFILLLGALWLRRYGGASVPDISDFLRLSCQTWPARASRNGPRPQWGSVRGNFHPRRPMLRTLRSHFGCIDVTEPNLPGSAQRPRVFAVLFCVIPAVFRRFRWISDQFQVLSSSGLFLCTTAPAVAGDGTCIEACSRPTSRNSMIFMVRPGEIPLQLL